MGTTLAIQHGSPPTSRARSFRPPGAIEFTRADQEEPCPLRFGEYATTVAARKAADLAGKTLSEAQAEKAGLGIHWAMGVGFGAAHGALRDRVPVTGAGHGLVHGTILFLLVDEAAKPLLGLAAGPTDFPWQAHARGLAGHLVLDALDQVF